MIGSREMGSHGYGSKELSINGLEKDGMYSYSTLDMLKMITVRNLLMLHEQTPVARVVMVLCFRDTYVCSVGFSNFLNRSPCSSWEQHCSFETASAPFSLVVFVVSQVQGNGRGSSVSRQNPMSADSSGGPVHAQASDKFIVGTRYLRVMSDGSFSRGSVIILKFFCHSVILFDSNLCFLFHSLMSLYILVGTIHSLEMGGYGFGRERFRSKARRRLGCSHILSLTCRR